MEIGSKLRAARQRTGFTQEQVGEAIHVSRQTISNWETGKSLPDVLSVISLSNLYQVSLDELLKGDEKMLRHIDEATNTVKSRQRLGKLVQTLSFLVIWAVCVAVFWLGGGSDAMGFSILVLYGVLPLSTFVVSLLMGLDTSWKERQWGMLLYFGVGFMLMPYGTFSLANMLSTGNIRLPEWEYIAYGMVYAMQGMCLGSVIRWAGARRADPNGRYRPLWTFGLVWGITAVALFSVPLLEWMAVFAQLVLPIGEVEISAFRQGMGELLFFVHCLLGAVAALAVGVSLGASPSWQGKRGPVPEKWLLLPLFGGAFLLSAGLGALMVPLPWARSLWPASSFLWGMLPPALGIAASSFSGKRQTL